MVAKGDRDPVGLQKHREAQGPARSSRVTSRFMRIALLTFGSRGDVQPFAIVGDALRARGHQVCLLASRDQTPFAERCGLQTRALPVDAKAILESERGQHLLRNGHLLRFGALLKEQTAGVIDDVVPVFAEAVRDADVVAVHLLLLPYAMALAEHHRLVRVFTAPMVPTSAFASPLFGRAQLGPFNRASHGLLDRMGWWVARDAAIASAHFASRPVPVQCFARAEAAGMPAVDIVSPTIVPRPDDAPAAHVFTGDLRMSAELRARLGEATRDAALEKFLDGADPPVFFGFGSMPVADPAATLALVAEVARSLGVRALLGAGWSALPPGEHDGGRVFVTGALDHDAVLPRCRAAVHHGGAGTTHTALRAGLCSVVCSFLMDQPWWADLLIGHGVGAKLPFPKLSAARLARALRPLLTDEAQGRARALAARMKVEDGVAVAVEVIERAARTAS
ncbi:MAG: glycosyltransferase family 1 protein [Deltaproteobacteria bacterium]|nr:glycosyltransferase family 1 protein [Deltaproteobacteria bacterium]